MCCLDHLARLKYEVLCFVSVFQREIPPNFEVFESI